MAFITKDNIKDAIKANRERRKLPDLSPDYKDEIYKFYNEEVDRPLADRNVYGFSLIMMMRNELVNPKYVDAVRAIWDDWRDSGDYEDFYTKRLEEKLLELDDSEQMHTLCHRIAVTAYHKEEGRGI